MLYGADYFTEDEWIKIDGLIHKGQYVFTNGPPTTNFLEDELMSFDDTKASDAPLNQQPQVMETFELSAKNSIQDAIIETKKDSELESKAENTLTTEDQSTSASPNTSFDTPILAAAPSLATPIPQSSEISSVEERASASEPAKAVSEEPSFDLSSDLSQPPSQEPQPVEQTFEDPIKRESTERPANGGLAYYSKEQLEELKAFNSGLTKAGEKKKPIYKKTENSYPSPDGSSEQDMWTGEESYRDYSAPSHDYPSPATTDEDNRIQNWASGVGSQANTVPTTDPKTQLVNDFIKTHGRLPKSINDVYQPNNTGFKPLTSRPASRATSIRPIKTSVSKSIASVVAALNPSSTTPHLAVAGGTILIAQSPAEAAPGQLRIEIREGDQIKVLKHVSGVLHYGQNMRTMKLGQFNEAIFRRPSEAQLAASNSRMRPVKRPSNGVERFERVNASEWDEVPATNRPKTIAPAPVRPAGNGLASSKYAVPADTDVKSEDSEGFLHGMTRQDVDKLVDERVRLAYIISINVSLLTKPPSSKNCLRQEMSAMVPHKQLERLGRTINSLNPSKRSSLRPRPAGTHTLPLPRVDNPLTSTPGFGQHPIKIVDLLLKNVAISTLFPTRIPTLIQRISAWENQPGERSLMLMDLLPLFLPATVSNSAPIFRVPRPGLHL
jgi:hypothetical protein